MGQSPFAFVLIDLNELGYPPLVETKSVSGKQIFTRAILNIFTRIVLFFVYLHVYFFNKNTIAMNTKLTLTIEQTVIEKAKKYAHGKGRSLSNIIENYLKVITKDDDNESIELTPIVKSLKGSFKAPKNINYKKELSKRLTEKYL